MQRLHELDPTGYLLEQELGVWTHIRIPLEAEQDETWTFPISGRVVHRRAGDILMPERFTPDTVEQLKGRRLSWSGQYEQRPAPLGGNLISAAKSGSRYISHHHVLRALRGSQLSAQCYTHHRCGNGQGSNSVRIPQTRDPMCSQRRTGRERVSQAPKTTHKMNSACRRRTAVASAE